MTDKNSSPGMPRVPQGHMGESDRGGPVLRPLADIVETHNGVSVQIEMPGVSPEDTDISIDGRMLTVRGRSRVKAPEGYQMVHAEYEACDYERSFALGQDVDDASIAAEMRDGVLTLLLPQTTAARPRKVEVKSG